MFDFFQKCAKIFMKSPAVPPVNVWFLAGAGVYPRRSAKFWPGPGRAGGCDFGRGPSRPLSSSSSTIKRLVRFARLTKVEMCWLSNMSLNGELMVLEILPSHLGNSRTLT